MEALNLTGFDSNGVFHITGTPSRKVVEMVLQRGLIHFPSREHRLFCLGQGPRPFSEFDLLPDEPGETEAK